MKHMLTMVIILVACIARAQSLTIIEQDYELAKRTAQQQHKLLLVDFYTTWCVPCKILDKTIFQNDSIAAGISNNFIVLKYDAENDSLYNLSLKHHVCSYPTTLVLTADGKLIAKMFGMGSAGPLTGNYAALLSESIALDQQGKYITGVTPTIDPDLYPAFYKKYVRRIANIKPGDLDHYWANNTALQSEVSLAILAYFGNPPESVTDYFIRHKTDYEKRYGKADVAFITARMASDKFSAAIAAKDETKYKAAVAFVTQHLPPVEADNYIDAYSPDMYIAMGSWEKATDIIEAQVRRKTIHANNVNGFCWTVYEKCNDRKIISRAAQLMKNITDSNASFAMLDTYARLLAKKGSKQKAIAAMKQAIAIGKANGEDTGESEEALRKF